MKYIFVAALFSGMLFMLFAQEKKQEPAYVGPGKCKMCHNAKAKGEQYAKWQGEKHSKAFQTLQGEEAAALANKMKIVDASTDPKCLKCHITDAFIQKDGVSCETCHGPGSLYKTMPVMKDKKKAMELGLIEPAKELCVKCHNPESPTYKPFTYEDAIKIVMHPNPQRKKEE